MNYLNERDFVEYQLNMASVAKLLKTARAYLTDEATHQRILDNPTYARRMKRMALAIDAIILTNNLKDQKG